MSLSFNISRYIQQPVETQVFENYDSARSCLNNYFTKIRKAIEHAFKIAHREVPEGHFTLKERAHPLPENSDLVDALFEDLGLIKCPDESENLPLNAIKESEYAKIKQVHSDIFSRKVNIKIPLNASLAFRQAVFLDLLILLTRSTSRRLILTLIEKHSRYHATILEDESHAFDDHNRNIEFCLKEYGTITAHTENDEGFFFPLPRFAALAHEMIHFFQLCLYGQSTVDILTEFSPTLNSGYDNRLEQEVIAGDSGNYRKNLDIYEQKILKEFGLEERRDHFGLNCDNDLSLDTEVIEPSKDPSDIFNNKNQFYLITQALKSGANLNVLHYLDNKGDIHNPLMTSRRQSLLHVAAGSKYTDGKVIQALLNGGLAIDQQDCDCSTPILMAISSRNKEAVKALLDNNCNLKLSDSMGILPIHLAARIGDPTILELLLDKDPGSVNAQDKYRSTPLHVVIGSRPVNKEAIQVLLTKGSRLDLQDSFDNTPLDLAKKMNNQEVIQMFTTSDN